jgi:hypothetical protein
MIAREKDEIVRIERKREGRSRYWYYGFGGHRYGFVG